MRVARCLPSYEPPPVEDELPNDAELVNDMDAPLLSKEAEAEWKWTGWRDPSRAGGAER